MSRSTIAPFNAGADHQPKGKALFTILIGVALLSALSSPLRAQTFAPVQGIAFTKVFAGANPLPQTLTINSTGAAFNFTTVASTSTGGDWLTASIGSGCFSNGACTTPHAITVTVNPIVTLAPGTYNGQIVFTSTPGAVAMTVPVTLTVAPEGGAFLDNLPGQLSFSLKTNGSTPPSQAIQVRNGGSGSLNWTLAASTSDGGSWLSASAASGTAPSSVNLTLQKANLPGDGMTPGTFTGRLIFQTSGGSVTVPVSVVVGADVFNQVNAISFNKVFAGPNPLAQTLTIASTGATLTFFTAVSTGTGGDWLTASIGPGCFSNGACNTPHTIRVTVNPNVTLPAGTYTGQIKFTTSDGHMSMTVPVSLTIVATGPLFDNIPGQVSFSVQTGGVAPPAHTIDIRNSGSGFLDWTVLASTSDGGNWLTVTPADGTAPSQVTVGVSKANLPSSGLVAGTFTGQLVFNASGTRVTVPVSVVVGAHVFRQVNAISFTKLFAGANPLPQTLAIASTGTNFTFFTASSTAAGGDWLSVSIGPGCFSNGACNTPHSITATVNPSPTLAAGTYTGQIIITDTSGSAAMTVPVTLTVAPSNIPFFDNIPGQISFSFKTAGTAPPAQSIQVRNAGSGTLNWTLATTTSDGAAWLTASAASGTAPSSVNISISKNSLPGAGLIAGTFTGRLIFQTAGGGSVTVPVSVVVGEDVFNQVNAISFAKSFSGADPLPQTLTIASTGDTLTFFTAAVTSTGGNWLTASIKSGCFSNGACNTPHTVTVSVNPSPTLAAGTYTGQIVFTSTDGAFSMTVPVTLTISPPATPFFDNVPGQMSFSFQPAGGNPADQSVQIRNGGAGTLNWTLTTTTADGGSWLNASAAAGTAPATVAVNIVANALPGNGLVAGTFTGLLSFRSATSSVTIPVSVTVGPSVFVQLNPVAFSKAFAGTNPLSQTLNVTSTGTVITFFTEPTTGIGGDWLTASVGGGCFSNGACNTPHVITISVNPSQTLPAGIYTGQIVFTATSGSMAMTVPVTFTVIGQTPVSVSATGGTPQSAVINTAFASPLIATVRDAGNNPVSGVTVTFTAPGSGASGSFAGGTNTAVTNAQGVATSAAFTANATVGSYNVTAAVSGVATSATFTLNNTPVVPTCVTSISPSGEVVPPEGKNTSFAIVTTPGCAWTASSSQSWLEIFPLTGTGSGAITWTAYPNFGTKTRTATATVGNKTFTVTQTASTETLMQRFVRLLYFSYLGRPATDAEVAGQVNSGSTRTQLATNFLNSAEFNLGGRFTAGLYVGIINRDAEFTGWQFQRQALARGAVNQDQLVSNFLNSAEFSLKFGVLTNADFVRLMYRNILLREAGQNEVDAWVNVLANPANTRTIVARSFLNSPEFRNGTGPRLLAFLLYATLLLRDASSAERGPIEAQLADPDQLPALIASFANGTEINSLLQ